jgi:ribosomal protein RSM22 (predicted rRNA methylase)
MNLPGSSPAFYMNLSQLLSFSPLPDIPEHQLIKAAEKLRHILTQKRHELKNYVLDDELVTAYIVFYFSSNISKWSLLQQIQLDLKSHWQSANVLDFGTGPGTFLYSFQDWMGQMFHGKLLGIDQSPAMLEVARKILGHSVDLRNKVGSEKVDLLIFGNSANEINSNDILNIVQKTQADDILFFEPGDKSTFNLMLQVRTQLLSQGFNVIYPCNENGVCPLIGVDDWCHQYAYHSPDISVERLMQKLNWDRRKLPMIMHLYSRKLNKQSLPIIQRSLPMKKFGKPVVICDQNILSEKIIKKTEVKEMGEEQYREGKILF